MLNALVSASSCSRDFFEHGRGTLLTGSERRYPISFHFAWSEEDSITIELPAGFSLDNADAPAPFKAPPISEYTPTIGVTQDGRTMIHKRTFFFGGGGNIYFPVDRYAALKQYFEAVHKSDDHTVTLKQAAATAVTP